MPDTPDNTAKTTGNPEKKSFLSSIFKRKKAEVEKPVTPTPVAVQRKNFTDKLSDGEAVDLLKKHYQPTNIKVFKAITAPVVATFQAVVGALETTLGFLATLAGALAKLTGSKEHQAEKIYNKGKQWMLKGLELLIASPYVAVEPTLDAIGNKLRERQGNNPTLEEKNALEARLKKAGHDEKEWKWQGAKQELKRSRVGNAFLTFVGSVKDGIKQSVNILRGQPKVETEKKAGASAVQSNTVQIAPAKPQVEEPAKKVTPLAPVAPVNAPLSYTNLVTKQPSTAQGTNVKL